MIIQEPSQDVWGPPAQAGGLLRADTVSAVPSTVLGFTAHCLLHPGDFPEAPIQRKHGFSGAEMAGRV